MVYGKLDLLFKKAQLKYWSGLIVACLVLTLGCGGGGDSGSSSQNGTTYVFGRYSFVRFSSDHGGSDTGASFASGIGHIDFDANGGFSSTITGVAYGQSWAGAFVTGTSSGTCTVTSDGVLTVEDGTTGYVSVDGNIIIWPDKIPADSYEETGISMALKEASGLSNASLNGRYSLVRFSSDHGGADTGAEFTSGVGYMDFDGAGNVSVTYTGTANGQSSGEAFTSGTFSGTCTVDSNGEVTFNDGSVGYVSADGEILVWTDKIPEDSYEETGIAVGVKRN